MSTPQEQAKEAYLDLVQRRKDSNKKTVTVPPDVCKAIRTYYTMDPTATYKRAAAKFGLSIDIVIRIINLRPPYDNPTNGYIEQQRLK